MREELGWGAREKSEEAILRAGLRNDEVTRDLFWQNVKWKIEPH